MRNFSQTILSLAAAFIFLTGCNSGTREKSDEKKSASTGSLQIVATTGQINAALTKLTSGTDANINLFCGPGVAPHSFSASTQDVQAMVDADLIVYNGFHLEAKLTEYLDGKFEDKSWSMASAFGEKYQLGWEEDGVDPHIWNHLIGWSDCVKGLAKRLGEADSANAETYSKNAESYVAEIMEAHEWAKEKLAGIPEERRVIVSAHDAFNYFAKEYNMEPFAVLGIGNDPEADIKVMREVAETVCEKKIPAIFMESISNPKVSEALKEACEARDWKVELVDQPLYSDDIGEEAPQNTYLGAFRSNVEIIFEALK